MRERFAPGRRRAAPREERNEIRKIHLRRIRPARPRDARLELRREKNIPDYAASYRRLASNAVRLYVQIEPLRGSRLGLASADSLLFSYSKEETAGAVKRLRSLEIQFSKIPAGRLSAGDVDRATVIINWLRGTRFRLRGPRLQPVESASLRVGGGGGALGDPFEDRSPLRRRTRGVPEAHPSHSRSSCERSGEPREPRRLARPARDREARHARRESAPALAPRRDAIRNAHRSRARGGGEAIRSFREYASSTLLPSSYGRLIIGSENLARIFQYDEMIDADPNGLVVEAEKRIERITSEKASLAKRIEYGRKDGARENGPGGSPPPNERFEARSPASSKSSRPRREAGRCRGTPPSRKPRSRIPRRRATSRDRRKAPVSRSLPRERGHGDHCVIDLDPAVPDLPRPAGGRPARERRGASLRASLRGPAHARSGRAALRGERHRFRGISSATFREGWRYLVVQELAQEIKKDDPELYLLVLDDWLKQYARLIVVLALHAGTMTSEAATQYLVDTLALDRGAAAREVLAASVSPDIAYPAISMILVDEMIKNVSYVFGYDKPQQELAKILLASRDVPLSMILPRTQQDQN